MSAREVSDFVFSMIASAAFLALTVLAASRGRRDPLARHLALLCFDLFGYCTSESISVLSSHRVWDWTNAAAASLAPALFYHVVCAFVGRRRALATPIVVSYIYFVGNALACLSPIVYPRADAFPGGGLWAVLMLAGMVVLVTHGLVLMIRHVRGASAEERSRTRLVMATVVIAAGANATDLVDITGATWSPHLGNLGLVVSALVLTVVALRVRLFERLSFLTAINAVAIALFVVFAEITVFRAVGERTALAVVFTVLVVLGALIAGRFVVTEYAAARERTLAHATLGRMAAQMAHDIKNPLASIRGAAQFLSGERAAGRSIDEQHEFLDLLVAQCDRLTRVVDQYHRIGRAEPLLGKTDLNDAAREAVKFLGSTVAVDVKLAEPLMSCETDRDLLVIALENVLRNAHEAAIDKTVHVQTGEGERGWVYIAVRDEGPGMDPRTRERALEGFFTTKSQGSGLGLAFVRRVIEAHRGKLLVDTQEGKGTTVRIELRALST